MSESHGHGTPHTDPHTELDNDDKLAKEVAEIVTGKDMKKVRQNPKEIADVLSNKSVSLIDSLNRVKELIANAEEAPKDKVAVAIRAKGLIIQSLETDEPELLKQKKEIEEILTKKREKIEKDDAVKEEVDKLTTGLSGIEKRDKKISFLETELAKDKDYKKLKEKLDGIDKLLDLLEQKPDHWDSAVFALSKKKSKAAAHDAGHEAGHGTHGAAHGTSHGTDTHGHAASTPAPHADPHAAHAPATPHADPHAAHAPAHAEHATAAVTEAKDFHAKDVSEFTKPEDISDAQTKWKNIVNDLGKKPKAGDELYWQNAAGEVEAVEDAGTTAKYWKFQEFMKTSGALEEELQKKVLAVKIDAKGKDSATLEEEVDDKAQEVLRELLAGLPKNRQALLYHSMGVLNKARAFEKIKNIIKLQIVPNVRKGKNTYEEERGEDGKVLTVDLKKFLEDHKPYGERMLANSQEVLVKLHKKFGATVGDLNAFRDVLIQVVKSKGSKEITGKATEAQAKAIYTGYLTSLDAHAGEKEVLALLISYKENPPYVFDLVNTTEGWELGTKKKINILEDFVLDGAMYQELRSKTGLASKEFNTFIRGIAPKYERMRSYIRGKLDKREVVKVAEMNEALGTELSETDLKHFQKLMTLPLWASKVGQAFKHAVYLDDEVDRKVPLMRDIQGPDTVKELNVLMVNVEEKLKRIAERLADERLDQELKEVGPQGWKQLWRIDKIAVKFWKRNAAEGYRQRYTEEFIKRLKEEPRFRTELMELPRDEVKPGYFNKLSGKTPAEGTRENISAELDAIAERFGISWSTNDLESYLTPNERTIENIGNLEVQQSIRNLCRDYADGRVNDAEFQNIVRTVIIPQVQALQSPPDASILAFLEESTGRGTVDIQKAGLLDKMRAHKAGLIALDIENMRINIKLGKAQNVDVKTQVKSLNWTDRLSRAVVETVQRNRFLGRFINPSTVAIMGYGLSNIGAQFATGQLTRLGALTAASVVFAPAVWPAVAGIAGGVAVGTLFSTLRQNKESLRLKAMKERRQALGYAPEDDRKGLRPNQSHNSRFERRLENENALYQKVPVETLINNITGATNYAALQTALAQAITLNEISEMGLPASGGNNAQPERIDLIKFSNERSIEAERFRLLRTISQAKLRLRRLGHGRDVNTDMQHALAAQRSAVEAQMKTSEANFQKIKRVENWKAAGIGAAFGAGISALGLLIPHTDVQTNTYTLTPKGPATMPDLEANLATVGYNPAQIADIKAHMVFDPSTNKLTQASVDYLRKTYAMTVDGTHVPGSVSSSILDLHSGTKMNQADLLAELKAQGINTSSVAFDKSGHLTPASIAYLKAQNADISEVVTAGPGGAMNSTGTAPAGWEKLRSIHFNDNQPHAPNKHILDELHFWWKGKPQIDPTDGQVHFTSKAMLDPSKLHSKLPAGVSMPSSGTQLKLGLEVKVNGVNHWKFFTPDANGDIALPPEYFDGGSLGVVAKGGDTLPGLKTHALAVGFEDSKGTYQVLASVKGNGSYTPTPTPSETIEFLGKVTKSATTEGSDTYTLLRDVSKTVEFKGAMPPIIPGAPMVHLEHEKKGATPPASAPATPPPAPTPAVTPTTSRAISGTTPYYGADFNTVVNEMKKLPADPYQKIKKTIELKNSKGEIIKTDVTEFVDIMGNPIERNVDREKVAINNYLSSLSKADTDRINQFLPYMQAMDEKCRVAINIPAYHEGKNIFHTLEEYIKQTNPDGSKMDPSHYEINIIANREASGTQDNTVSEVRRFKAAHPEYRINILDVVFPDKEGGVGAARKLITDLTLKRSISRSHQSKALYIETEDADLIKVDKKTVSNIIEKMDQKPYLDAVRGVQDRSPEILMKNDLFFLDRRAGDFMELIVRQKKYRTGGKKAPNFIWNRTVTGGWNTAFSAEAYAKIGGYNPDMKMGEDMYIGQKISILRGATNSSGEIEPETETVDTVPTRIDSSPRRFLMAFAKKEAAYAGFGETDKEKNLRDKTEDELLDVIKPFERITDANKTRFEEVINNWGIMNFLQENLPSPEAVNREFDRLMFFLGFKKTDYTINPDGKVEITNIDNVKKALDDYRANPKYLKRKA